MKNIYEQKKKNKFIIFLVIFSIIYFILIYKKYINIEFLYNSSENSIHFDLITVNSIFSGFLFSSLSLIVGLNDSKLINNLEKAGFMNNIYFNILFGISCSLISIALSLIMVFIKKIQVVYFLHKILIPGSELLTLIMTIIIFTKSVIDVKFIIKSVRKEFNDDIEDTLNQIK